MEHCVGLKCVEKTVCLGSLGSRRRDSTLGLGGYVQMICKRIKKYLFIRESVGREINFATNLRILSGERENRE